MQALTVKEIEALEDDMVVMAIEAKLANVWDRKTGENDNGEWSVQPAGLKIGSETIRATFFGYPDLKKEKGKSFRIESTKGQKGWFGIKTQDNSWKMDNGKADAPERELKISDSAKMMPLSGDGSVQADSLPQASPSKTTTRPSKAPSTVDSGLDPLTRAQNQLARVKIATEMVIDMVNSLKMDVNELGEAGMAQVLVTAFRAIDIDSLPITEPPQAMTPEKIKETFPNASEAIAGAKVDNDGDEIPF